MAESRMETQRKKLHTKLLTLCDNVYYQPPSSVKMVYPCIRYEQSQGYDSYADGIKYMQNMQYQLMVISPDPDTDIPREILELPYTTMQNHYVADNLHHFVIALTTIY